MSPRPKGRLPKSDLKERILQAAWAQIALEGAPALSLRSIARSLNIATPSIYNHFANRDALVTDLIVAAFTSLGDFQEQSIQSIPMEEHAQRLRTLGLAYREWAIAYPERYQLIFGTPIAGYVAPINTTMPSASRSLSFLTGVLNNANISGRLYVNQVTPFFQKTTGMLAKWRNDLAQDIQLEVLYLTLTIWSRVHGMVIIEIGNQYPPLITHAGDIFRCELENIIQQTIQ